MLELLGTKSGSKSEEQFTFQYVLGCWPTKPIFVGPWPLAM